MLEVASVREGSPAAHVGLQAGDRILRLNGQVVRDVLDFHFHLSERKLASLEFQRGAEILTVTHPQNGVADLGLSFGPLRTRLCGNDCVFCFIDQNPSGLRPTLYVKDEDYRLSFLHGNFITLTNLKDWEIDRILEQRLSPLFISVHSTNPETRRRLLRAKGGGREIGPVIDRFRDGGIVLHTQVVLCPGYNDGEDLSQTVEDLAGYYPTVRSIGIVPLGLTSHREQLVPLTPVDATLAKALLAQIEPRQATFRKRWGIRFVYLADEWYSLAGRPVPPSTHYDGFPQIENGIGLTRQFLNRLGRLRRVFPESHLPRLRTPGRRPRVTLVTGTLFHRALEESLRAKLERTQEEVDIRVVAVENRLYGPGVNVAGLIVGKDILHSLRDLEPADLVLVPPDSLNHDGVFLDDTCPADLERALEVPVRAGLRDSCW